MINFLNMQYFVLIAEKKNITRVAEDEHVSQQSLSKHIKKIEDELGLELIDRNSGGGLTYAGERFYEYAVKMLQIKNEMEKEMHDMKDSTHGVLRLGIAHTRGMVFLPEILPSYCEQNPYVKVSVTENNPRALEEYLLHGHIDLYVGINIRRHPSIEVVDLFSDRLYIIAPKKMAEGIIDTTKTFCDTEMELSAFSNHNFIMLTSGNPVRNAIDKYTSEHKIELSYSLETESAETMFALSCKGMGISVYNEFFLKMHSQLLKSPDCPVCVIPLKNIEYNGMMSIGYIRDRFMSRASQKFIQMAKELVPNLE